MIDHILLADDSDRLRRLFTAMLREERYKVTPVSDGQELIDTAIAYTGDIESLAIVSDTNMPHYEGDHACREILRIRPEYQKAIIIGMSNDGKNEEYWRGVSNFRAFIHKSKGIDDISSPYSLAKRVKSMIAFIGDNTAFTRLPDGEYRRD